MVGYGVSCDAYHMTAPAPEGIGGAKAMINALQDASLEANQIDYINAHGTSTPMKRSSFPAWRESAIFRV